MNIISSNKNSLSDDYFDLKIPANKLQQRFDAHLLSEDEKQDLKQILEEWKKIAQEKLIIYKDYKGGKAQIQRKMLRNYNNNPFSKIVNLINNIENIFNNDSNYFFGSYDKETRKLQALGVIEKPQMMDDLYTIILEYLVSHPNNIRTRCNKNVERKPGAASSVIYAIANLQDNSQKVDRVCLIALNGARTYYEHINFKPMESPKRFMWELPLTTSAKESWIEANQDFLKNPNLDYGDKTEETSEEI